MVFLKRPSQATSDAAMEATAAKLRAILQSVRRCMLPAPEPLSHVLRRLGATPFAEKTPTAKSKPAPVSEKTREGLKEYAKAQKLT